MTPMLVDHPYLVPVVAGFLAAGSAVLFRKAAQVFGEWLGWLSLAASVAAALAFLAGFLWAATMPPVAAPTPVQIAVGFVLALGGSALAGWALHVRGIGVLRAWRADRFEQNPPFWIVRRPLELGTTVCIFGLCWLRPAPTVWICLAAWTLLWNVVLELGDWELRQRLPSCRDYLKRTPRYVPKRRFLRRGPTHSA
jgi:hypothetical protein